MDARQLSYFLGIVDHGSFGRAAEKLHIAQPSLSQSMKQLERELGVKLFRRAGRGVTLSEPGQQLVGPARQVVRSLQSAHEAVRSTRDLITGVVDLIAMPSPGIEPLTTLIGRFRKKHPGLSVHAGAAFTPEETIEATRSGSVELGLLGTAGDLRAADLHHVRVERQPLVLISPPGILHDETVQRSELSELDFVVSQTGSLMRDLVDEVLTDSSSVHIVAEVAHRTSLLPLVLAGMGHSVMPESWRTLAEGLGCAVSTIEPQVHLEVSLLYRRGPLSPAAEAFLDITREHIDRQVSSHVM